MRHKDKKRWKTLRRKMKFSTSNFKGGLLIQLFWACPRPLRAGRGRSIACIFSRYRRGRKPPKRASAGRCFSVASPSRKRQKDAGVRPHAELHSSRTSRHRLTRMILFIRAKGNLFDHSLITMPSAFNMTSLILPFLFNSTR